VRETWPAMEADERSFRGGEVAPLEVRGFAFGSGRAVGEGDLASCVWFGPWALLTRWWGVGFEVGGGGAHGWGWTLGHCVLCGQLNAICMSLVATVETGKEKR